MKLNMNVRQFMYFMKLAFSFYKFRALKISHSAVPGSFYVEEMDASPVTSVLSWSTFRTRKGILISLAWGHPTNFSMWSGDIQYSKLYNLAEILRNFKSAKIHFC